MKFQIGDLFFDTYSERTGMFLGFRYNEEIEAQVVDVVWLNADYVKLGIFSYHSTTVWQYEKL